VTLQNLLDPVVAISKEAGRAILDVYIRSDHGVTSKDDRSPLTAADTAAHHLIVDALRALTPDWPVLSEEAADIPWEVRQRWTSYWLVDPLDGTREFINRNGEFTVNIALIEEGVPVLGVVYVPVQDLVYCGVQGLGAWKETATVRSVISCAEVPGSSRTLRVVASRNHRGEQLDGWLEQLEQQFPVLDLLSIGSSLKICLVGEGRADVYPRLALTSEWDTAAAQAVLEAAGGMLVDLAFKPLRYNRRAGLLNPFFLAIGDRALQGRLPG